MVDTLVHTPRRCGHPSSAGTLTLSSPDLSWTPNQLIYCRHLIQTPIHIPVFYQIISLKFDSKTLFYKHEGASLYFSTVIVKAEVNAFNVCIHKKVKDGDVKSL